MRRSWRLRSIGWTRPYAMSLPDLDTVCYQLTESPNSTSLTLGGKPRVPLFSTGSSNGTVDAGGAGWNPADTH